MSYPLLFPTIATCISHGTRTIIISCSRLMHLTIALSVINIYCREYFFVLIHCMQGLLINES